MTTVKPADALARADALLVQAANVIQGHSQIVAAFGSNAWPATYLPLSILLGKALTSLWRAGGKPVARFRYTGTVPAEPTWKRAEPQHARASARGDGDHVVPLAVIIDHLLEFPGRFGSARELEPFLRQHLVMAHIPRNLDRRLKARSMPADHSRTWHLPTGPGWAAEQKREATWGRYGAVEIVALPWQDGAEWEQLSAAWLGPDAA